MKESSLIVRSVSYQFGNVFHNLHSKTEIETHEHRSCLLGTWKGLFKMKNSYQLQPEWEYLTQLIILRACTASQLLEEMASSMFLLKSNVDSDSDFVKPLRQIYVVESQLGHNTCVF